MQINLVHLSDGFGGSAFKSYSRYATALGDSTFIVSLVVLVGVEVVDGILRVDDKFKLRVDDKLRMNDILCPIEPPLSARGAVIV